MGIKSLFQDVREDIANIIRPKTSGASLGNFLSGTYNLWDAVTGKMQPTDFVKQVEANTSWVYACCAAIAESVAMQPLRLYLNRTNKTEEIKEHIFLDLMQNVNPFMNNFELRELTELYQLLCGNAYWYLVKNKIGVPVEIWIVPAQYMRIVPDAEKFIIGYIYEAPGYGAITFDVDEIVHFKYPNPNDLYYGVGPLLAAAYAVDTDEYMNQYGVNTFKNSGLPAAVLLSDQNINESDSRRMREQWKQLYGGTSKAGKVAILAKGLKFEAIQLSAQEMSYIQSKNVTRDTILGIFRVPKSVLGLVEDVNRANAEATEYIFNLRTVKPKLLRSQEKINEKIMPLYKQPGSNYLFVKYDDPVPQNKQLDLQIMQGHLTSGYSTINEERENNGDKPVDWGKVPILPMNLYPFGSAPEAAPATETPAAAIEPQQAKSNIMQKMKVWNAFKKKFDAETYKVNKIMIQYFERQRKEVIANLESAGKSFIKADIESVLFDMGDWEKELSETMGPEEKRMYKSGVNSGQAIAGLNIDFDLNNPETMKWLKEKIHRFSFETNETTINQLKSELQAGTEAGETTAQLAERINKVFGFAEKYRGMRIARTEFSDCENKGIFDVWGESESVTGKEWLHGGGGEHPRPEHETMSGEVVDIEDTFSNGLLYPGDQINGDAGDVCNCTCTLLPVTKNA